MSKILFLNVIIIASCSWFCLDVAASDSATASPVGGRAMTAVPSSSSRFEATPGRSIGSTEVGGECQRFDEVMDDQEHRLSDDMFPVSPTTDGLGFPGNLYLNISSPTPSASTSAAVTPQHKREMLDREMLVSKMRRDLSEEFNKLSAEVVRCAFAQVIDPEVARGVYAKIVAFERRNREKLEQNCLLVDGPGCSSVQFYNNLHEQICAIMTSNNIALPQ